ncbi:MAG TPA: hypothetical protein GX002_03180 [Clostridiales bacterium]|nr:hypothetical protein [Clostridiales bacterium]
MKKIRNIILALLLSLLIISPTTVLAASYSNLPFSFVVDLIGITRYYDAGNINVTCSSSQTTNGYVPASTTFTISLYKDGFLFDTLIGSITAKRSGTSSGGWTNMASGDYYFRFQKHNDGCTCSGTISVTQ